MRLLKTILVTGGTGFVGSHILDSLVERRDTFGEDLRIFATRRYHLSRRDKVEHLETKVEWIDCDITDPIAVNKCIDQTDPDEIFHMAAESFVSPSWDHPSRYMSVNYNGTLNILDALRTKKSKARILLPGSGEEYGLVSKENLPITDQTPLNPVNPYAVTKIAQDLIGYVYFKSYGIEVIRVRTFNHEGPRRERYFGISSYCYQLARIEQSLQPAVIEVGDTGDERNFTHVKDIVRAYTLAMKDLPAGELYLIGSDSNENIDTFSGVLQKLISKSSYTGQIEIKQVSKFTRPTTVPYLLTQSKIFSEITGWEASKNLNDILDDVLDYWRQRIKIHPEI
jgi:GDP-4-dehydro-6-deoxy-D-mannose reductase